MTELNLEFELQLWQDRQQQATGDGVQLVDEFIGMARHVTL